jgi:hypothetical protein
MKSSRADVTQTTHERKHISCVELYTWLILLDPGNKHTSGYMATDNPGRQSMEEVTEELRAIGKFGYWTLFGHCQEGDHGWQLWSICLAVVGLIQEQHTKFTYDIEACIRYDYALLVDPDPRRPYCRAVCGLVHGIGESQCVHTCTRREHVGDPEAHEYPCDDYNEPDLDLFFSMQTTHEDGIFTFICIARPEPIGLVTLTLQPEDLDYSILPDQAAVNQPTPDNCACCGRTTDALSLTHCQYAYVIALLNWRSPRPLINVSCNHSSCDQCRRRYWILGRWRTLCKCHEITSEMRGCAVGASESGARLHVSCIHGKPRDNLVVLCSLDDISILKLRV